MTPMTKAAVLSEPRLARDDPGRETEFALRVETHLIALGGP